MLSCSKDKSPDTPSLSISPSAALAFSAAGTETFTITVSTNQASWDATSNQAWCKVQKTTSGFVVTADPNTSATASPTATITVTAGNAPSVKLTANQSGATNYPANESELVQAITQNWNFPEASDYISLEFGENKSYTLLSKQPLMRASEGSNIYLLSGTYTVSADLHTFNLSDFGAVVISTLSKDNISMTVSPTGGKTEQATVAKQVFDAPPSDTYKHMKSFESSDENMAMTFVYDANKKLQQITDGGSIVVDIVYENSTTVKIEYPTGTLDDQPVNVIFKLNSAGLAISATVTEGSNTDHVYFSYNNKRQLISIRSYDRNNAMNWYRTATWSGGNMASAYLWTKNEAPRTETYRYATYANKANAYYPFAYGEFYTEFLVGAIHAGILGQINANLPTELQDDGAQLEYKTFDDGYPTLLDITYPQYPQDNYTVTIAYE